MLSNKDCARNSLKQATVNTDPPKKKRSFVCIINPFPKHNTHRLQELHFSFIFTHIQIVTTIVMHAESFSEADLRYCSLSSSFLMESHVVICHTLCSCQRPLRLPDSALVLLTRHTQPWHHAIPPGNASQALCHSTNIHYVH